MSEVKTASKKVSIKKASIKKRININKEKKHFAYNKASKMLGLTMAHYRKRVIDGFYSHFSLDKDLQSLNSALC